MQAGSVVFDRAATLEKLERLTGEAARGGAQLVVFPEAFVSGYPMGLDFGAVVGNRTPEGREQFRLYYESAVDVPGPDIGRLEALASELKVHLVVGVIEREGGTLYCSVLYVRPGRYLGKHRKLMPTAAERLVWGFGDGSTLDVYATDVGRIGAVICWENYMPMLRMAMYSKGVQIYCSPTADSRETWVPTVRHIALEGRCFVLSTCQVLRGSDSPARSPKSARGFARQHPYAWRRMHYQPPREAARGAGLGPGDHPVRRPRSRRDTAREIRLRRRRPLCAAGHLQAHRRRDEAATSDEHRILSVEDDELNGVWSRPPA